LLLGMSNRRKPRNRRHSSSPATDRLAEASLDQLRGHFTVLQLVDRAEARGDAAGALRLMQGLTVGPDGQPFWRPSRLRRLEQLTELRDVLPGWATSRWILAQALQVLDPASRVRGLEALAAAIDVRGGEDALVGVDRIDAQAEVMDHDWVYRQLFLYELGGLWHFLDSVASADLVAAADRVRDWASVPMGAYRLVSSSPGELLWEDLATGAVVSTTDLGVSTLVDDRECAIGRLVPIEGGWMFEAAPLPVPERVARRVAAEPGEWPAILREYAAAEDRVFVRSLLGGLHDYGLLNDLPDVVWRSEWREMAAGISRLCEDAFARAQADDPEGWDDDWDDDCRDAGRYGEDDWDDAARYWEDDWDDAARYGEGSGGDDDPDAVLADAASLVTVAGAMLHSAQVAQAWSAASVESRAADESVEPKPALGSAASGQEWLIPLVAAALVVPGVVADVEGLSRLASSLTGSTDWDVIADLLPEPAASVARGLAARLSSAA